MPQTLDERQRHAAELLGQGRTRAETATTLEVDPATVSRWKRIPEFIDLVRAVRHDLLDENPDVRRVLNEGLSATTKTGEPNWHARLQAAKLLLTTPADAFETPPDAPTVVTFYRPPPRDEASDDPDS